MTLKFVPKRILLLLVPISLIFTEPALCRNGGENRRKKPTSNKAPQPKIQRKTDKVSNSSRLHLSGQVGMASYTFTESVRGPYKGFEFGGGAFYRIPTGSLLIDLGGSLHYTTISNSEESQVDVSHMTIRPTVNLMFSATPQWTVGGFFGTDLLLLSGKYSSTNEDGEASSLDIKSMSHTIFGARGLYELSDGLSLGAQFGMGNGSISISIMDYSFSAPFKSQEISFVITKSI